MLNKLSQKLSFSITLQDIISYMWWDCPCPYPCREQFVIGLRIQIYARSLPYRRFQLLEASICRGEIGHLVLFRSVLVWLKDCRRRIALDVRAYRVYVCSFRRKSFLVSVLETRLWGCRFYFQVVLSFCSQWLFESQWFFDLAKHLKPRSRVGFRMK